MVRDTVGRVKGFVFLPMRFPGAEKTEPGSLSYSLLFPWPNLVGKGTRCIAMDFPTFTSGSAPHSSCLGLTYYIFHGVSQRLSHLFDKEEGKLREKH
jgi:hypothetical protein